MFLSDRLNRRVLITLISILILTGSVTLAVLNYRAHQNNDAAVLLSPSEVTMYTDRNGQAINLTDLRGKPLVVNAWASWSPFSANELPTLALLKAEYGDRIEVIAVNRKEPAATIEAYLGTIGNTDGIIFVNDGTDHFFSSVMGYAMPETLFYNAEGDLIEHTRGTLQLSEFKEKIEALIQE